MKRLGPWVVVGCAGLVSANVAPAETSFIGRPIYAEPRSGVAMPPGCNLDPNWRARLANSDLELWVADCGLVPHLWLVRRFAVAYDANNQARLRFEVIDERRFPNETAGETVSIQCSSRKTLDAGYAVVGATWRSAQPNQLTLVRARLAIGVDAKSSKLIETPVPAVDCVRFLDREEQMRRLQGGAPRR